jgi:hypothetical protein
MFGRKPEPEWPRASPNALWPFGPERLSENKLQTAPGCVTSSEFFLARCSTLRLYSGITALAIGSILWWIYRCKGMLFPIAPGVT